MFTVEEMNDLEPRSGWLARRRWRKARRCVNCSGRGWVTFTQWNDRGECPDCRGHGYYRAGGLWGDKYRSVDGDCPQCGADEKRYCHSECTLWDPCQPH